MPSSNHQKYYGELKKLEDAGLSTRVANDVLYMRKQPEHTPAREKKFIEKAKDGNVPDVTTFK